MMTDIEEYIRDRIQDISILLKLKVVFDGSDEWGFYSFVGRELYEIHIPLSKRRLTWLVRKTLDHEIGHIIFYEMAIQDPGYLTFLMMIIYSRKTFCMLQRVWYWNSVVRFFKRLAGFSTGILYKMDDPYMLDWTRGDNELFCDFYAWSGLKSA